VLIEIIERLKDKIVASHQDIGKFTIYMVYERIQKLCYLCALLGHDQENYSDPLRLSWLQKDEKYRDRPKMTHILDPKLELWVTNAAIVPRGQHE
jgi:hypothetical protein